jgi:methylenetetrahydrofolate--tRNA-(uracil-5-)-methyltransferase
MGERVTVVGGGLAGCECALQLARRGVPVTLFEERPERRSAAHVTDGLAELVCSNSLKSTKSSSAAGLLKNELDAMGCCLLDYARQAAVPAGGALAVDRKRFSELVEAAIVADPGIELVRHEVTSVPDGPCVIACGPLCSDSLFADLSRLIGSDSMSFYDAVAPIVDATTIDRTIAFPQSRYEDDESSADYLNCPFEREGYEAFWHELVGAKRALEHAFDRGELFCACQPVEEVARTGVDALRFGALKPVGLTDPRTGRRPWAVVQLRAENRDRTAYNLVGFQTNLTWPEQRRVFRMIPGLENAEFFRYGVIHRNSFVDAPHALDATFAIPGTSIRLAGQICGTEGYTEAIASGLLAALNTFADLTGAPEVRLPVTGALGSLVSYATSPETVDYQPMHVNFGLVPPLDGPRLKKQARYERYAARAMEDLGAYIASRPDLFGTGGERS